MSDYDRTPDSVWTYREAVKTWVWSDAARSWPDDMPATTCGDWIDQAIAVLQLTDLPEMIRTVLLRRLFGASHYCTKNDEVYAWSFDDDDLDLVQWLAGPYPTRDTPTNGR